MKIRKSMIGAATGVLLTVSGMAVVSASPQKRPSAAATTQALPKSQSKSVAGVSRGTITSINSDRLVLSRRNNGKQEELTFMLNSKTERKGELASGAEVNVNYRTENNQMVATAIQTTSQKSASDAKKRR